ncbi:MAG: CDP-alcohol phosphatidyltransferase family protein [Chloroflexota bacterium]|nr:CDP-alcohol phosphatidyltransferase family protein [Chloroflexota bacterium]
MADYFERSRESLRSKAEGVIIDPVVSILVKIKCTPNLVTVLGFFVVFISAFFATQGNFKTAGILVMASGLMDVYDGALARRLKQDSEKGAFLDSTLDRLGEAVILVGIIYYYSLRSDANIVVMASISIVFSLMISYLRARIEGLGYSSKSGIFTRPERILIVGLGLIFFSPISMIVILTIAVSIGLVHRFFIFWKLLRK